LVAAELGNARLWRDFNRTETGRWRRKPFAQLETESAKRKNRTGGEVAGRRYGRRNSKGRTNPSAA
jgi:hypothetical protein